MSECVRLSFSFSLESLSLKTQDIPNSKASERAHYIIIMISYILFVDAIIIITITIILTLSLLPLHNSYFVGKEIRHYYYYDNNINIRGLLLCFVLLLFI